jgi:hypothetical protein
MQYKFIDIDFVEPNKNCKLCDHENDYVCFDCESEQVRKKYPNAKLELPEWILERKKSR